MMLTVQNFIDNNENCRIKILESQSIEEIGIFNETLFDGMLFDVPDYLRGREVVDEGYLLIAQCNELTVLREDNPNVFE